MHLLSDLHRAPCSQKGPSGGGWRGASGHGAPGFPCVSQKRKLLGVSVRSLHLLGPKARLSSQGDACEAPADSQQGKAEPQLSSAVTLVGMQGDGATDKARWIKYIAFGPCAKSRRHKKLRLLFLQRVQLPCISLHSPNLLFFFKKLILTQDCKHYTATR